jgi:hypothetical protein
LHYNTKNYHLTTKIATAEKFSWDFLRRLS